MAVVEAHNVWGNSKVYMCS